MRRHVVFLVVLALCGGFAAGRATTSDGQPNEPLVSDLAPRLPPDFYEGLSLPQRGLVVDVLPPRWQVGDTWRVAMGVRHREDRMIQQRSVPAEYDEDIEDAPSIREQVVSFTVTSVPEDADGHYVVEGVFDTRGKAVFNFRAKPFMLESVRVNDELVLSRGRDEVGPNITPGDRDMNLAFPYLPPDDPNDNKRRLRHRVFTFGRERDVKMRVERVDEGVWFVLWNTVKGRADPVVFFWKHGDPWWSYMAEMCQGHDGSPMVCRWGWLARGSVRRRDSERGTRPGP